MKRFSEWLQTEESTDDVESLIEATENVDTIGYHVSKNIFDKFDQLNHLAPWVDPFV